MDVVESGPLTDAQRVALEGGEAHPFGTEGLELRWRAKDRHVMLRDGDGRLCASTGLLLAEVSVDGAEPFEVVGLGGVIVAPGHRGQGLGRRVAEAALERAARMGPAFALLFCRDAVAGLYLKLGFQLIEPPVRVLQPVGSAVMPLHTMWRGLQDRAVWPPGPVLVRSQPF
jgi:predicted N-acetyltransferase YhbS